MTFDGFFASLRRNRPAFIFSIVGLLFGLNAREVLTVSSAGLQPGFWDLLVEVAAGSQFFLYAVAPPWLVYSLLQAESLGYASLNIRLGSSSALLSLQAGRALITCLFSVAALSVGVALASIGLQIAPTYPSQSLTRSTLLEYEWSPTAYFASTIVGGIAILVAYHAVAVVLRIGLRRRWVSLALAGLSFALTVCLNFGTFGGVVPANPAQLFSPMYVTSGPRWTIGVILLLWSLWLVLLWFLARHDGVSLLTRLGRVHSRSWFAAIACVIVLGSCLSHAAETTSGLVLGALALSGDVNDPVSVLVTTAVFLGFAVLSLNTIRSRYGGGVIQQQLLRVGSFRALTTKIAMRHLFITAQYCTAMSLTMLVVGYWAANTVPDTDRIVSWLLLTLVGFTLQVCLYTICLVASVLIVGYLAGLLGGLALLMIAPWIFPPLQTWSPFGAASMQTWLAGDAHVYRAIFSLALSVCLVGLLTSKVAPIVFARRGVYE